MNVTLEDTFGLLKTKTDAHTMGVNAARVLIIECGYNAIIADADIQSAIENLRIEENRNKLIKWIVDNGVTRLGFSYRLDPEMAVTLFDALYRMLVDTGLYKHDNCRIKSIHFAGLPDACTVISEQYGQEIETFKGGETPRESLRKMSIDEHQIAKVIDEGCSYDTKLIQYGHDVINLGEYKNYSRINSNTYERFGTEKDSILERIDYRYSQDCTPAIRAHSGPFYSNRSRKECLDIYEEWVGKLAKGGLLDVLSIGTSQLTQSNFGENWEGRINGGGVPINSEDEFSKVWMDARPMLVRTYAGTANVLELAKMYDRSIHNAWHALSLWWFDELDGRGPNGLLENLKQHIETIYYLADKEEVLETNVPHHFAFRGCDDVTYVVSGVLSAKLAKLCGIKYFILQNMLNTPRATWGTKDLAKSRAMTKLVRNLEDETFSVKLQTRVGLDYFKPNLEEAKEQLAAVTAMMDDIEPENVKSPEIIHVVSYSEGISLATPEIINESIQITLKSLTEYRKLKKENNVVFYDESVVEERTERLVFEATRLIEEMEKCIPNLYSAEGLYLAYVAGWLPTPDLANNRDIYCLATNWCTDIKSGEVNLVIDNVQMDIETRIAICKKHTAMVKSGLTIQKY